MAKTVAFHTLGCKVNQNESDALAGIFRKRGYKVVPFDDKADVYVVNTCTVTHMGDRKSRQVIRRAAKANPDGVVAVMGCYAQVSPGEVLEIPGVDLVVGAKDRARIVDLVEEHIHGNTPVNLVGDIMKAVDFEELEAAESPSRTRVNLKIQEGCHLFCSYCIIPYARGPMRSRPPEKVMAEAESLAARGFQEIVLTGIHTGGYGLDLPGGNELADLLEGLVRIEGLKRIRISSVEPTEISDRLIELMVRHDNLCRHLHIPLQSGSDAILSAMNRRYTTREYREIVAKVRQALPGIAITTDVMVGFPGESEALFEEAKAFVREMDFAAAHVFKYSPRKGTPAASFPDQVSPREKERRSKELTAVAEASARAYARGHLGKTLEVLVEEAKDGLWLGHTGNYLKVGFPADGEERRGTFVQVLAREVREGNLLAGERVS